jgi:hypothetical protein
MRLASVAFVSSATPVNCCAEAAGATAAIMPMERMAVDKRAVSFRLMVLFFLHL